MNSLSIHYATKIVIGPRETLPGGTVVRKITIKEKDRTDPPRFEGLEINIFGNVPVVFESETEEIVEKTVEEIA